MSTPRKSVIVVKRPHWIEKRKKNDCVLESLEYVCDVSIWASLTKLCKAYGWNETALLQKKMPFNHEGFTIERQLIQGL